MVKADFSSVMGGKKRSREEQEKDGKIPEKTEINTAGEAAEKSGSREAPDWQASKRELEEKIRGLEEELKRFSESPKEQREEQGENFEFKKITEQIREKAAGTGSSGFSEEAVERAAKENAAAGAAPAEKKPAGEIERVTSGIYGLDGLIEGGFEKGGTVLVVGSAGSGKTLFCLQFLNQGAVDSNEPGIFISFEEGRESLYRHSSSFGWDFEELERKGLFRVLEYKPHQVEKLMQEGGGPIRDAIKELGAKRLVIDSVTAYGLLFKDEYAKRENILGLFDYLRKWGCTSLIISELPPKVAEVKEGSVGFLTDAIISLYYSKRHETGERVHSMEILKMRGTKHTDKLLAIQFEKGGIRVYSDVEVF